MFEKDGLEKDVVEKDRIAKAAAEKNGLAKKVPGKNWLRVVRSSFTRMGLLQLPPLLSE